MTDLSAPFPRFGGKRAVASVVWERFGKVENYVEPFFGTGAVPCVNPAHMFLGTHRENAVDMVEKGRGLVGRPWPERRREAQERRRAGGGR